MRNVTAIRKLPVIAFSGLLAVLAAGVAYAAIPSADGTIHACYDKQSGQVRIFDPDTKLPKGCGPREAAISWGVEGPAGQDGADGQDGVSGYQRVYGESQMNSNADKWESVFCPAGKKVVGGGAGVWGPWLGEGQLIIHGVGIVGSYPFNETGWGARAMEFVPTDDDWYLSVYAICADVN